MFKVMNKSGEGIYKVYDVQTVNGNIKFLIYNVSRWEWIDANYFIPFEEEGFRP